MRTGAGVLIFIASMAADGAAPDSLLPLLAENDCLNIPDDAAALQNGGRWWISLERFTGAETDFAFYCQDANPPASAKLILVVRGEQDPWRECSAVVDAWNGSLPFRYHLDVRDAMPARHGDLGRWWPVSSSSGPVVTYGPAGVPVPGPIIDTTYPVSGAGTIYACHAGQWYRVGLD